MGLTEEEYDALTQEKKEEKIEESTSEISEGRCRCGYFAYGRAAEAFIGIKIESRLTAALLCYV